HSNEQLAPLAGETGDETFIAFTHPEFFGVFDPPEVFSGCALHLVPERPVRDEPRILGGERVELALREAFPTRLRRLEAIASFAFRACPSITRYAVGSGLAERAQL